MKTDNLTRQRKGALLHQCLHEGGHKKVKMKLCLVLLVLALGLTFTGQVFAGEIFDEISGTS